MDETILTRLVQIGIVTAVNTEEHKARVKFRDTGISSDWLLVLQRPNNVTVSPGSDDEHTHETSVSIWMPKINDAVVVLYLPIFNSDGYILGGV